MSSKNYELKISKKVIKEMKKLPKKTQEQILRKIKELRVNPERIVKRIKGHTRFSKLRVGEYRVIVEIVKEQGEVIVIHVGHRSKVYEEIERFL